METALDQFSGGGVRQPLRSIVDVGDGHAFYGVMPAYMRKPAGARHQAGVRVPHATRRAGLPSHLATIVLHDPETGALQAVIDGRYITEARTAAVSAASTKHLARADARVLAVLGSGVQARSHIEALTRVRAVRGGSRLGAGRGPRTRARSGRSVPLSRHASPWRDSAHAAAAGADVIALVTASREPVLTRARCPRRRAHLRGRRVPPGSARDGHRRSSRREGVRGLARRRAGRSRRPRHTDPRRGDRRVPHRGRARRRVRRTDARPAQRRARSRSSNRWGWRSKTSRPRAWPSIAPQSGAWVEGLYCRTCY